MARAGRRGRSALAFFAVVLTAPLLALATVLPEPLDKAHDDLAIIVSQTPGYVEVFIRADARALIAQLGGKEELFVGDDGMVDWERLTTDTQSITETLFPSLPVILDGRGASMEPMSLMLHPREAPQPFADPVGAIGSIGPCGTEQTVEGRVLADAVLHIGFIIGTDKTAPVNRIALPFVEGSDASINQRVRHFVGYDLVARDLSLEGSNLASKTVFRR